MAADGFVDLGEAAMRLGGGLVERYGGLVGGRRLVEPVRRKERVRQTKMSRRTSRTHRDNLPPQRYRAGIITFAHADFRLQGQCCGRPLTAIVLDRLRLQALGFAEPLLTLGRSSRSDQRLAKSTNGITAAQRTSAFQNRNRLSGTAGGQVHARECDSCFLVSWVDHQRDDVFGVTLILASLVDIRASEGLVRSDVVRCQGDRLLEDGNGSLV